MDAFKKQATLSHAVFEKLLAALGADRDDAGQQYERIRRKLVRYFEINGCRHPDNQADEVIDRVAAKINEGLAIQAGDPATYFYGVARYVLKEYWARSPRDPVSLGDRALSGSSDPDELLEQEAERVRRDREMRCLEICLKALPDDKREWIVTYYQGDAAVKIANRKALAEKLGTPINALRSRVLRVRETLEKCLEQCLTGKPGESATCFS